MFVIRTFLLALCGSEQKFEWIRTWNVNFTHSRLDTERHARKLLVLILIFSYRCDWVRSQTKYIFPDPMGYRSYRNRFRWGLKQDCKLIVLVLSKI